jgi:hypothetical protein
MISSSSGRGRIYRNLSGFIESMKIPTDPVNPACFLVYYCHHSTISNWGNNGAIGAIIEVHSSEESI